ncbi:hypothetical protein LSAT2_004124, partial [Lamellibrachia satsuma]
MDGIDSRSSDSVILPHAAHRIGPHVNATPRLLVGLSSELPLAAVSRGDDDSSRRLTRSPSSSGIRTVVANTMSTIVIFAVVCATLLQSEGKGRVSFNVQLSLRT